MLFRKNEWDLVEGAWGLLLLDGMISTRSNIQRHRVCYYASEVRGKSLWMTFKQRCYQSKAKQDRCLLVYKLNNNQNEGKSAVGSGWRLAVGRVSACSSYAKNCIIPTWLVRKDSKFTAVGGVSACRSYAKNFTIPNLANPKRLQNSRLGEGCRLVDPMRKTSLFQTWLIRKESKIHGCWKGVGL